jgi:Sec-independent protein translocase protein TatA
MDVPSLMDLVGIIVILFVVFGFSVLPRIGESIARRLARSRRPRQ